MTLLKSRRLKSYYLIIFKNRGTNLILSRTKQVVKVLALFFLFVTFYKRSGKFRQSVISAFAASIIAVSSVSATTSADAAFGNNDLGRHERLRQRDKTGWGAFGRTLAPSDDNSGFPNGDNPNGSTGNSNGGGNDDGGNDGGSGFPQFPNPESVEATEERGKKIDDHIFLLGQITDSDTESENDKCINKSEDKPHFKKKKKKRRNQHLDRIITLNGRIFKIFRSQVEKKTPKHGVDMGLEPDIGVDGKPKLDKSTGKPMAKGNRENFTLFAEKLEQFMKDSEMREGYFRKGRANEQEAMNFYDVLTDRVASFNKKTGEFISAWKMDEDQLREFLNNNNVI